MTKMLKPIAYHIELWAPHDAIHYKCPECDTHFYVKTLHMSQIKFCFNCGVAIDWSNVLFDLPENETKKYRNNYGENAHEFIEWVNNKNYETMSTSSVDECSDYDMISGRVWAKLFPKPDNGWKKVFNKQEKLKLRPMAETLAMLDGNAFFDMPEHYEGYLPEAAMLYAANGGDDGWAGLASFANINQLESE